MATAIDTRFWLKEGETPNRLLGMMLSSITSWQQIDGDWQGLRVIDRSISNRVYDSRDQLTISQIESLATSFDSTTYRLSTSIPFKCWRFVKGHPQYAYLRLRVDCWGRDYANMMGRELALEGDCSLYISQVDPYVALLDTYSGELDKNAINEKVEDNLEKFTVLLLPLIEAINPLTAKVFTDNGQFIPVNAHAAYYKSSNQALQDYQFLKKLWNVGVPSYQIPPLDKICASESSFILHPWRSPIQRTQLHERLASSVDKETTEEQIETSVHSGRFDVYSMTKGFTLLEYPHMFNAFVDRFLTTVNKTNNHSVGSSGS